MHFVDSSLPSVVFLFPAELVGFKFYLFLILREEERQSSLQLCSPCSAGNPWKMKTFLLAQFPHETGDWLGSKSFWCSSFPWCPPPACAQRQCRMVALSVHGGCWYPLCCWLVMSVQLCPDAAMGSWGCPVLCVPSLCGSVFLSPWSLELVQRGQTMPGAVGKWEQPPG